MLQVDSASVGFDGKKALDDASLDVADCEVVRPEAVTVRAAPGSGVGVVEKAVRTGPVVRLRVRLDDGRSLEAVVAAIDHPRVSDRVDVDVDPRGIVPFR